MVNRIEIRNKIFDVLKQNKILVKNIIIKDGYYIFDYGKDSVINFNIKGGGGWKFGIWIIYQEDEDNYLIRIFSEHKIWINKFKPSATSGPYLEFYIKTSKEKFNELLKPIISEINKLKAKPLHYAQYTYDFKYIRNDNDIPTLKRFTMKYSKWYRKYIISYYISILKDLFKKYISFLYMIFYVIFLSIILYPIASVKIKNNLKGFIVYPQYSIIVKCKKQLPCNLRYLTKNYKWYSDIFTIEYIKK